VPLLMTGRQVTSVSQAVHKHLIIGQAIQMVRAVGLGRFGLATSSSSHDQIIKNGADFERLVEAAKSWFGYVLDHFGSGMLDDGVRDASVFSDPDRVLRAVPVKVALGVMGHAWFEVNRPLQEQHKETLENVDWRVSPNWQGIAGKVSEKTETRKVDGKTVPKVLEGEYKLAASGAKELGGAAVRALTNPETVLGRRVRGEQPDAGQSREADSAEQAA
jgi:hypothetical protein